MSMRILAKLTFRFCIFEFFHNIPREMYNRLEKDIKDLPRGESKLKGIHYMYHVV